MTARGETADHGRNGIAASTLKRWWQITLIGAALSCTLHPSPIWAQRAVDVQIGNWEVPGPNLRLYSAGYGRQFLGPVGYGFRGTALVDPDSSNRSLYALSPELRLRASGRLAPYAIGGVGLALQPAGSAEVGALWYAGLGLAWNPASWLGVGLEVSYLAEDAGFRGFWDLGVDDRQGWAGSVRFAFRWGGSSRASSGGSPTVPPPSGSGPSEPSDLPASPAEPLSSEGTALAYDIVDTAIGVMGEPYRWGGTSTEEGFDCSGLIYYAYGEHGVSVPRVSRDQARSGRSVPREVSDLAPGDILLFANGGSGVNHVGLYVGNRRFIHATTSGGVKVSELETSDSYNRWWYQRWVGARRMLD